jgi:predicted acyltransferase
MYLPMIAILVIIMVVLAIIPAIRMWTPLGKKLWAKIAVCILSSLIAIFLLSACVELNNKQEAYD